MIHEVVLENAYNLGRKHYKVNTYVIDDSFLTADRDMVEVYNRISREKEFFRTFYISEHNISFAYVVQNIGEYNVLLVPLSRNYNGISETKIFFRCELKK